jgi:serine/threonine-protein kinase HipA
LLDIAYAGIIAMNRGGNPAEMLRFVASGQAPADEGFAYWLMKFDGVSNNRDKELADPEGFGLIEYAFSGLAVDVGIEMSGCRLYHEGGRSHFMTRRIDRTASGRKLHVQSLAGLRHFDFNAAGTYSWLPTG